MVFDNNILTQQTDFMPNGAMAEQGKRAFTHLVKRALIEEMCDERSLACGDASVQHEKDVNDNVCGGLEQQSCANVKRWISAEEVRQHNRREDAWVVFDGHVCDMSKFIRYHPGGQNILTRWAGKDISKVVRAPNGVGHEHSENAKLYLKSLRIGHLKSDTLPVKYDEVEVRNAPEDCIFDEEIEHGIDWSRGIALKVHKLGARYEEWVERPVGWQIRLFDNDVIETYLSHNAWWKVILTWLPLLMYWLYTSVSFATQTGSIDLLGCSQINTWKVFVSLFTLGTFCWSILEYCLHRCFHLSPPPTSKVLITLHFLYHGIHHKSPYDKGRLVFPPALSIFIVVMVYLVIRIFLKREPAIMFITGVMLGYLLYDMTHYYLHFGRPQINYLLGMKSYHAKHHFIEQKNGFGIWHKLWDIPFGTLLED